MLQANITCMLQIPRSTVAEGGRVLRLSGSVGEKLWEAGWIDLWCESSFMKLMYPAWFILWDEQMLAKGWSTTQ